MPNESQKSQLEALTRSQLVALSMQRGVQTYADAVVSSKARLVQVLDTVDDVLDPVEA